MGGVGALFEKDHVSQKVSEVRNSKLKKWVNKTITFWILLNISNANDVFIS